MKACCPPPNHVFEVFLLSCSDNLVGDEGAARLGEALQINISLISLDLGGMEEGRERDFFWHREVSEES